MIKKVLGILLSVAFAMIISHSASASEFNPGRIIDDEIFYDSKAMGFSSRSFRLRETAFTESVIINTAVSLVEGTSPL